MADKFKKQIDLTAQGASKTASDINKVGTSAKKTETSVGSLIKKFAGFAVATAAVKKTFDAMAKNVELALKQEKIYTNLQTTVEGVGKAWGDEEKALQELFATQQAYTKFGDTDSAEMLNTLIELSGDYEASVNNLALAQDLASTSQFNAQTAAKYMGMALAGNVEMLGRYVAELRTTNPEFAKLETKAEKTEYALRILNEKFGGKAQAQMDSVSNKIQRMKNYWGDYQEMLGDKVTPVVGRAADAISEFFAKATETNLDTTIRQLKEMGAEMGDIEELVLINNLLKADETLEKVGNQFDKAAKKANRFKLSGKSVTDAISEINGKFVIDTEKAQQDISALRDRAKEYTDQLSKNKLEQKAVNDAIKNGTKYNGLYGASLKAEKSRLENVALGLEWKIEGTNNGRRAILGAIAADKQAKSAQDAYNNSLEKYVNVGEKAVDTTQKQATASEILSGYIDELGKKYEYSEKQLIDFKESFNALTAEMLTASTAEMLSNSFEDIQLNIPIDVDTNKARKDISEALKAGDISEQTAIALNAQLDELTIGTGILEPLEQIPEEDRVIEVDLRTDGQKFLDDYGDIMQGASDIAGKFAQIYSNIIENKYQKELRAMKGGTEYQRAEYDERRKMEEDLQGEFAEQRIKAFRLEQAASIGEATINTAMAVMQALGSTPPPMSFVMAGISAAMGAAQIGIIASQPVPAYAEGGIATYPHLAMVGDSGTEGILNPYATREFGIDNINALNAGASLDAVMPTISNQSMSNVSSTINKTSNKPVYATINNTFVNPLFLDDKSVKTISDKIERQSKYNLNKIMLKD